MPTKPLTPREALAIARWNTINPPENWETTLATTREHHRGHARCTLKQLRKLGFTVVPLPSKKGRKRG